ncbi:MAG: hypothetical protein M3501_10785, partial [Actinomycetota bacterium]|nr:hypothetical protein [Actinomycetota bacterium]
MTATMTRPPDAPDAALADVDDALERLDRALRALAVDGFDAAMLTSAGRRAGSGRATLDRFDAEQDDLLIAAGRQPLSVFRRTVTRLVEGLHADAGADRNQRLHHRRSLRRWWDDDGMRHWHLSIDAEAAARIDG